MPLGFINHNLLQCFCPHCLTAAARHILKYAPYLPKADDTSRYLWQMEVAALKDIKLNEMRNQQRHRNNY